MQRFRAGAQQQALRAPVRRAPNARGRKRERAGLCGSDELGQRLDAFAGAITVTLGTLPNDATAEKSRAVSYDRFG